LKLFVGALEDLLALADGFTDAVLEDIYSAADI
jgi:hypothetical protein